MIFDGPNKTITIEYDGSITSVTAAEMYVAWKDWMLLGNAQYQPAFAESVGGNPLGGGVSLSGYFFLRNDLGWRFTPEDGYDYEIRIKGDLYPANADTVASPWFVPSDSAVLVTFDRSAASSLVLSDGGSTAPTAAQVADAVWDEALSGHVAAGTAGKRLNDVKPTLWGL